MQQPLPKSVTDFKVKYPEVWEALATLGDSCHQTGPLDEKTRRDVPNFWAISSVNSVLVILCSPLAYAFAVRIQSIHRLFLRSQT